jgi:2-polyprenyl-6-methoxyphenol hydroxylase-like FAD-dependent oxidoreductase
MIKLLSDVPLVGIYPAKDALCCFVAATAPAGQLDPAAGRIRRLRARFKDLGGIVPRVLAELPSPKDIWHDDFYDLKLQQWRRGRAVLIGDAAAAILPTAGVGASVAMESAAVLADELSRTDAQLLEHNLERFIDRRRARVDRVQRQSRILARYALVDHPLAARARDIIVCLYSQRRMERAFADLVSATI